MPSASAQHTTPSASIPHASPMPSASVPPTSFATLLLGSPSSSTPSSFSANIQPASICHLVSKFHRLVTEWSFPEASVNQQLEKGMGAMLVLSFICIMAKWHKRVSFFLIFVGAKFPANEEKAAFSQVKDFTSFLPGIPMLALTASLKFKDQSSLWKGCSSLCFT